MTIRAALAALSLLLAASSAQGATLYRPVRVRFSGAPAVLGGPAERPGPSIGGPIEPKAGRLGGAAARWAARSAAVARRSRAAAAPTAASAGGRSGVEALGWDRARPGAQPSNWSRRPVTKTSAPGRARPR